MLLASRPSFLSRSARAAAVLAAILLLAPRPAAAQIGSERYASIIVDAGSGAILSSANPDEPRFPASLTKMMTLYMVFEAVRDRRITLSQYVPISANAASMSPTKLGLVPGSLITVEQAVLSLVTKSANDAAAALGEMLGGDEERFAQMMTLRARALGMTHTQFRNASGLPDWGQVTTARDMAILARRLIDDFPTFYHYFSTPMFAFAGRVIHSHQRLLQSYPGADGLKTGYTDASGFNVVTSALHGDVRLIGVVFGAASGGERDLHMATLLDQGFERMGAPVMLARREPAYRLPALISAARAAPQEAAVAAIARQTGRAITARKAAAANRAAQRASPRAAHAAAANRRARASDAYSKAPSAVLPVVRPASNRTINRPAPRRFPG